MCRAVRQHRGSRGKSAGRDEDFAFPVAIICHLPTRMDVQLKARNIFISPVLQGTIIFIFVQSLVHELNVG